MPTVVASIVPRPEHRDKVREVFLEAVPQVHDESGCELYAFHENGERFVMVERWASGDALQGHLDGPLTASLIAALDGRLAAPINIQVLDPLPAGDVSKGAV